MCDMGGGGKSQTVKQEADPWEGLQPYLERFYKRAEGAYDITPRQPYPGQLVANPTQNQLAARYDLLQDANAFGNAPGQRIMDLATRTAQGDFLSPQSNPFLSQAIQAALNPVTERFQEQVLPQAQSAAIQNGAYGGARDGFMTAQAMQDYNKEALDTTSRITYENYARERGLQSQAPQMFQQAFALSTIPDQMRLSIGDMERQDTQQLLDAAFERWEMARAAPWAGLAELGGAITTGNPGASTTQRITGGGAGGGLGGLLQGGMGGAMMGSSLGPLLGLTGPWGMAAGAALGGLGGLFG